MIKQTSVILKAGREKALRHRHHWIFSGAVDSFPPFKEGDFLPVYSADGTFMGTGYFNRRSGIVGRMVSFDSLPPLDSIVHRLEEAVKWRSYLFENKQTNAYRLINGEGDGIPGLILDVYDQVVVLQSSTKGIDLLKPWLINWIEVHLKPRTIYEKSLLPSRKEEGLQEVQGYLKGDQVPHVSFKENGLHFSMNVEKSQKTGFFLDHREMREWIKLLAKGKRVLNAFSYTGGFTVYALAGQAKTVDSVDISEDAIEAAKKNLLLNEQNPDEQRFFCADVFQFLREKDLPYDLVILDPPAFAKKQKDIIAACRGYKDINRLAMQKMPSQSLLLTCSCSHYVDEELFQKVLFQAAVEARRQVRIVGRHRLAPDHPINLCHPESHYLKSFLLYLE
ncbi:MAG: class I SAM-dependent rRNA methyltransferase [Parachlamydiaceae bacterium]